VPRNFPGCRCRTPMRTRRAYARTHARNYHAGAADHSLPPVRFSEIMRGQQKGLLLPKKALFVTFTIQNASATHLDSSTSTNLVPGPVTAAAADAGAADAGQCSGCDQRLAGRDGITLTQLDGNCSIFVARVDAQMVRRPRVSTTSSTTP
jgi:hypothetical protein